MTIKTVGLIGAGLMGHGIGKNIVEKGFALVTMARRNRAPVEQSRPVPTMQSPNKHSTE